MSTKVGHKVVCDRCGGDLGEVNWNPDKVNPDPTSAPPKVILESTLCTDPNMADVVMFYDLCESCTEIIIGAIATIHGSSGPQEEGES